MKKDFPLFQYSVFTGTNRSEQYVVRADTWKDLQEGIKKVKEANKEEEDIAEKVVCPIHKVAMQHFVKYGDEWWSHQTDNGWCTGKDNKTNRLL